MQENTTQIVTGGTPVVALPAFAVGPAGDTTLNDAQASLIFQNQSSGLLTFTMDGSAPSATNGFQVAAGQIYERQGTCVGMGAINVWGASSNQQFYIGRGSSYGR